jgi:hypothetical protein
MKKISTLILRKMMNLSVLCSFLLSLPLYAQQRSKTLDFDDSLVEAVNKKPLDSYNQIADRNRKRIRPHLYQKRAHFDHEMSEKISALGLEQ